MLDWQNINVFSWYKDKDCFDWTDNFFTLCFKYVEPTAG